MACTGRQLDRSRADAARAAPDKDRFTGCWGIGVGRLGQRQRERLLLEQTGCGGGDGEGQHSGGVVGQRVRDLRHDERVERSVELEAAVLGVLAHERKGVAVRQLW